MGKENAMNALEMMLILMILRLILPFGLLLMIGEWFHRYEQTRINSF
jgi:hypothetical protein